MEGFIWRVSFIDHLERVEIDVFCNCYDFCTFCRTDLLSWNNLFAGILDDFIRRKIVVKLVGKIFIEPWLEKSPSRRNEHICRNDMQMT